jgi:hypothetical protein
MSKARELSLKIHDKRQNREKGNRELKIPVSFLGARNKAEYWTCVTLFNLHSYLPDFLKVGI